MLQNRTVKLIDIQLSIASFTVAFVLFLLFEATEASNWYYARFQLLRRFRLSAIEALATFVASRVLAFVVRLPRKLLFGLLHFAIEAFTSRHTCIANLTVVSIVSCAFKAVGKLFALTTLHQAVRSFQLTSSASSRIL